MRHDPRQQRAHRRREDGHEFRDRRPQRPGRPLPDRTLLHRLFDTVCAESGAEGLAFDIKRSDQVRAIVDRKGGNLTTEFMIRLIRAFRDAVRSTGFDPEELDIEFDSPGENRELTNPEHWERFKGQRVRIEWKAPGPSLVATLQGSIDGHPLVRGDDGAELRVDPATMRTMRMLPLQP